MALISPAPPEALAQLVLVPSDFKYLFEALAWLGNKALRAALAPVCPVPPLAIGRVPVTPVVKGRPVPFVRTTAEGVPSAGVTKVGDEASTTAPLPVVDDRLEAAILVKVLELPEIVLFVNVAEALFLVVSLVLSTLPNPTSALTNPTGEVIVGLVRVLLVNVSVELIVGIFTAPNCNLSLTLTPKARSALLALLRHAIVSVFANLTIPVAAMLLDTDLKYLATTP
jgi:hypothetical protein